MKDITHRIFSMVMAVLLLASTTSWTVGKHYCMGRVMDISFFSQAEDCGMQMPTTLDSRQHNWEKKNCCDNDTVYITGQNDLKVSLDNLTFEQNQLIVSWVIHTINLFEGLPENIVPFNLYPPPILVKDIPILDQSFLI